MLIVISSSKLFAAKILCRVLANMSSVNFRFSTPITDDKSLWWGICASECRGSELSWWVRGGCKNDGNDAGGMQLCCDIKVDQACIETSSLCSAVATRS